MRLPGERVIVDGLDKPHDPRYIDDEVLCESGRSRLVAFDDEGREIRSCLLEGFTRGLAFDKDHFVGESRLRQRRGESRWSRLVVLDRRTWRTVESIEVPMAEIYALCISPTVFVRAASRGLFGDAFDVIREGPLTRLSSPWCEQWSISERLTSRRAQLDTVIPSRMPARSHHNGDAASLTWRSCRPSRWALTRSSCPTNGAAQTIRRQCSRCAANCRPPSNRGTGVKLN